MCGIFGFSDFKLPDLEKARDALSTLRHRGPDQWNDYFNQHIYLGHRRLSILDLSENGKQPMVSSNAAVVLTVNGEIYNFQQLRKELESDFVFKSTCDSEVLLHGYVAWGFRGLLERIDGMYAIALFDKVKNKIFLARDRVGIKPLFYSIRGKQILWASELKAIERYIGNSDLEIDYTALYDFFTYQYIPAPKSLYKDVFKLQPAEYIEFDVSTSECSKFIYWEVPTEERKIQASQAEQEVYDLLEESVREQMMSDVPIGFFLSGGMDSSAVVAIATHAKADVNTFTIGFDQDPNDETVYAKKVASYFRTKHIERILDGATTAKLFPKIKEWYDEPFGDISCFPTFLVSKIAKEKATVVLTGDGGDEIFGGYKWYKVFSIISRFNLRYLSFAKNILSPFILRNDKLGSIFKRIEWLLINEMELYVRLMGGLLKSEKRDLRKAWGISEEYDDYWYYRKYYRKDLSTIKRLQYLDFHTYLPDDILTKLDRVSMAVSLECRVPFLSRKIIESVFTMPQHVVVPNGKLKGLLKNAFKAVLPAYVINRSKKGFSPPIQMWRDQLYGKFVSRHYKIVKEVFFISTNNRSKLT